GCLARSIAFLISAIRLVTPVDVSLCTTITALKACCLSFLSCASTSSGDAPRRQLPGTYSTCTWCFSATCFHREEKCPVSNISTRSPGLSEFTIAASHAPVPDDGKITTGPLVLK